MTEGLWSDKGLDALQLIGNDFDCPSTPGENELFPGLSNASQKWHGFQ